MYFCIDQNGIGLFFYIEDIVFVYKRDRKNQIEKYVNKLKLLFEIKNIDKLIYFFQNQDY